MRGFVGSLSAGLKGRLWARNLVDLGDRFARDEQGIAAIFFGVIFAVILLGTALAVDFSRATHEQAREQAALDAAVLAASTHLGLPTQDSIGRVKAQAFFKENLRHGSEAVMKDDDLIFNEDEGSVSARANSVLPTTMMRAFQRDSLTVGAASTVRKGQGTMEVALVLDNSGSMCQPCTKIEALRTAAENLVDVLFTGVEVEGDVKVGLVPFSAAVNVGSGNRGAAWIDGDRAAPIHSENFDAPRSRFDLFDELGQGWAGCVESRPGALDTSDAVADPGNPDSMFVPMFAPDEPDGDNDDGDRYQNNYLPDDGGTCARQACTCTGGFSRRGRCNGWSRTPLTPAEAQSRTCKYKVASTSFSDSCSRSSSGTGPNYMCTSRPILPLTHVKQNLVDAIQALPASGYTNIGEGTMWGWRVLSPSAPFTEGRDYNTPENTKVMIIMTDGENTYYEADNHNRSYYGAHGYAAKGRIGTTYTSGGYTTKMNTKLTAACAAAKSEQITIYTVAFGDGVDADTKTLLTNCATTSDNYYVAASEQALIQTFQRIAQDIAKLRVAS